MEQIERIPTTCVLDGDIIAYKAAYWAETEGIEYLPDRIKHDIKAWTPPQCDTVYVALSCDRSNNFRRKVWDPYKRHRDSSSHVPPDCLSYAIELVSETNCLKHSNIEADDIMGMMASSYDAVAVTIDKDLRSVRGWHWNPMKEEKCVLLDARTAEYNFHSQWLSGDTTDNVPGIWRCGPAKAAKILGSTTSENWTDAVLATYEQALDVNGCRYGYDYAVKMAQCVRILRHGEYDSMTETIALYQPYLYPPLWQKNL